MVSLPQVGVQAVILGLSPFMRGAKSVDQALTNMGRSLILFERSTQGAGTGLSRALAASTEASERAAKAHTKLARISTGGYATIVDAARAAASAEVRAATDAANATLAAVRKREAAKLILARKATDNAKAQIRERLALEVASVMSTARGPGSRAPEAVAARREQIAGLRRATAEELVLVQAAGQRRINRATQVANVEISTARRARDQIIATVRDRGNGVIALAEAEAAAQTAAAEATIRSAAAQRAAIGAVVGTAVAASAAIAVVTVASTISAAKYEKELVNVAAIGELTAAGQNKLSEAIVKVGENSTVSVSQLAKGSSELVKAGVDIEQVLGGALQVVNDLTVASGGELGLADAAVLVAVGLNAFSKNGATATSIANAATAAVQRSSLTFSDYSIATRQAANVASIFGLANEEFAATLGVVGKTIKSGSEAGTGLRQVFLKLIGPSAKAKEVMREYGISLFDASGAARPWRDILVDLNREFGDGAVAAGKLTEKQRLQALETIFEARAIKVVTALLSKGTEGYDEMREAVERIKTSDLAEKQLGSTAAKWTVFTNNVNIAANALGNIFLPFLNDVIEGLAKFVKNLPTEALADFAFQIDDFATSSGPSFVRTFIDFVANSNAVKGAIIGIGAAITISLLPAFVAMIPAIGAAVVAIGGAVVALGTLVVTTLAAAGPWAILAALVAVSVILILRHGDALGKTLQQIFQFIRIKLDELGDAFSRFGTEVNRIWTNTWSNLAQVVQNALNILASRVVPGGLNGLGTFFSTFGLSLATLWNNLWNGMVQKVTKSFSFMLEAAGKAAEVFGEVTGVDTEKLTEGLRAWSAAIADITTVGQVTKLVGITFDHVSAGISDNVREIQRNLVPIADAVGATFDAIGTEIRSTIDGAQRELDDFLKSTASIFRNRPGRVRPPTGGELSTGGARGPVGSDETDTEGFNLPDTKEVERTKKRIEELFSDLTRSLEAIARKALAKTVEIGEGVGRKINEAIIEADKNIKEAQARAEQELAKITNQQALERSIEFRRELLESALKQEALIRDRAFEDADRARQRALDAEERDFSDALQAQQDALNERHKAQLDALNDQQEAQLGAAQIARDRFELERQFKLDLIELERDFQDEINKVVADANKEREKLTADENRRHIIALGNARTPAQREAETRRHESRLTNITQVGQDKVDTATSEFDKRKQDLERRKAEEFEEFERRQTMAQDESNFRKELAVQEAELRARQAQEVAALQLAQDTEVLRRRLELEDLEFADRRARQEADRAFTEQQDLTRRALQQQLDDEDEARARANIISERDARIDAVNQELEDRHNKIRESAALELVELQAHVDEQLQGIRDRFNDQLPDIMEGLDEALIPLVDNLAAIFEANFFAVQQAALDAAAAIAEAIGAFQAFQSLAGGGVQVTGDVPQFAEGGVVPGPKGKPSLAVVHGGERYAGVHGERASLLQPSVGAAAAVARAATTNISKSTSFTVNANYGRTQSEGSIILDLRALAALRR